ncbi:unnamed protein product [Victoria cruziana]
MAKGFLLLSLLLLSSALLINARVPTLLPEHPQEAGQDSLVDFDPKLLLPSENQESEAEKVTRPAEPLTLRGPIPTEEGDLFPGNRHHAHRVYITRPFLFRFPRRFHHQKHEHDRDDDREDDRDDDHDDDRYKHRRHHHHFMGSDHFFPEKEGEIEIPIRGAEFEGRFLDENHFPSWLRGHYHRRHHDHHHRFYPDGYKEMKRRYKHGHEEKDDEKPAKGGVFKWFSNLLNTP